MADSLVTALRSVLDGRWGHVRRQVCEALPSLPPGASHGLSLEENRSRVYAQARALAASGIPRLGFAKEYGGGGDIGGSVVSLTMLGGDLSLMVKAGVQWGLFGGAIAALGTERHHEAYLPQVMDFSLPGCFAMTETGHGSDVQRLRTTAVYDPSAQQFVIETPHEAARKDYIGNAARDGRLAVVFAQLITGGDNHGVHAFLVPIRDAAGRARPGVTIGDCGAKAGLPGVDNGRLSFSSVRVPRDSLLNRYGDVSADGTYSSPIENPSRRFFTMLGTLIRGRVCVAGTAGSSAQLALSIAVRYGAVRRQFTPPDSEDEVVVLDYLAHQRRLLPAIATSYALAFAQEELTGRLHDLSAPLSPDAADSDRERRDHEQRELEYRAAGLKAVTTWHALHTIQSCREACGGAGYLAVNQFAALRSDVDVFTTFEGDNTVLLQLVAKGLLTSYRDHIGGLDPLGVARFVASSFAEAVIERSTARELIRRLVDAAPGTDEEADVRDRGWQLKLFEDREKHVLETLARRLRKARDVNGDGIATAFETFNAAQDHVLRAARVHVDRIVLEAFVAAIDRCGDASCEALLTELCDLYVLSNVEADLGWFLQHGRLTPARAKAVTAVVNELCRTLRPHAVDLVDGFGVPEQFLTAPIGTGEEAARQDAMRTHDAKARP
ncbi:MAG: acyl-CoA dehydrogenase [Micromonosporaceae bacterium]